MTFESTKFYINKNIENSLNKLLKQEYDRIISINTEREIGLLYFKKIKSQEIMTREQFNNLIDYLKEYKARMESITFYMHTEGEYHLKSMLEKKYAEEKNIDLVVESNQLQNILSHTDLEMNVSNFMKWFMANQHLLETEISSTGIAVYRTKIIDLKGYDSRKTWEFIKEASKGAYFKKIKQ